MTTTTRQNNLLLNQDWTRIYQTFKNADFKSYDFENLRRVILTYLRENYPEDFNDYIESSEYMALIDAVAFLGQSLAFRIDLASRENFIELADRKESVLRIAKMLGYNAKRNLPASGLLKFTSVTTTEDLRDSNGKNLSNQIVSWNDPTNADWLEQFLLILNSAMADSTEFGRSQGNAIIQGIPTEQYRLRTVNQDVPIFTFSKTVAGRSMAFEIVSTGFKDSETIYEEPPVPGNQIGFVYRNDNRGPGSANTGFFLLFKQGSLELADFELSVPTPNEVVSVDSANVNNDDIWLFRLNDVGAQIEQWEKVSNLIGNNIAYNSISENITNIYAVSTKDNDRIDLLFSDGVYGALPQGTFRIYYRVSNGLTYAIAPNEMKGINISIPYINKIGVRHTLKIGLGLQTSVNSASSSESIDNVRVNAPAQYYTQNRMITAEDYNLAPLTSSQDIVKVKSVNRISSGVSRNFDILDATGKYSSVNVFADDGFIYKKEAEKVLGFKFLSRIDVINFIKRSIELQFKQTDVYNFYLTKFDKILFTDDNTRWKNLTTDVNLSTGYFENEVADFLKVGVYSTGSLKYVAPNSLVKFVPPDENSAFKNGEVVVKDPDDPTQTDRIWVKVVRAVGDGTNAGRGILTNGLGPIMFNDIVPSGAIARRVVPGFVNDLDPALESEMVSQILRNLNFGLRYDSFNLKWVIIDSSNLNLTTPFNLGQAGNNSNNNLDSSWIIAFIKDKDEYLVRIRTMEYVFGSVSQNRFYFDINEKKYNDKLGKVVRDYTKVLGINKDITGSFQLHYDIPFQISDSIKYPDGYESTSEIKIGFSDDDDDGVIDNPEAFEQIVGTDQDQNYLFFKESIDNGGNVVYILDQDINIIIRQTEQQTNPNDFLVDQLVYFSDSTENKVKKVVAATGGSKIFQLDSSYRAYLGRDNLKFQYVHNASVDRRIDPSVSNIIDVFLLTRSYDEEFRRFLSGASTLPPEVPSNDFLRINYGSKLNEIKSISDEIIYHSVRYRVLFGKTAEERFQAQFKVVKNPTQVVNDNDLKVRIINAINDFFDINNWDFGDKFYISELITYILNVVAPDVSNIVVVPRQTTQSFGSLFEIQSNSDEIFVSGATVDDITIISSLTAAEIRAASDSILTRTN